MKIKLHSFEGTNDGTVDCDFRKDKFIGADQGDHHQTLAELDNPSQDIVAEVLTLGPRINALLNSLVPAQGISAALGMKVGLRIGVWPDEDNSTSD